MAMGIAYETSRSRHEIELVFVCMSLCFSSSNLVLYCTCDVGTFFVLLVLGSQFDYNQNELRSAFEDCF